MSRADRLLRAAVTGYCALTRPRRYDAQQLQDLAMPLVGSASRDTLRYVAAAISKCETQPPELVRELARMPADIAAPLLARSPVLTDTDLIILIGAHGVNHARAIGRRENLNPSIAQLIRLIDTRHKPLKSPIMSALAAARAATSAKAPATPKPDLKQAKEPDTTPESPDHMERARDKLRTIMLSAKGQEAATKADPAKAYTALRDAALEGGGSRFVTALSEGLGVSRTTAWIIARDSSFKRLIIALRAIGLNEEQAFLVISALYPHHFRTGERVTAFLERFRDSSPDNASRQLDEWQAAPLPLKTAQAG